jgi:hypothetical protein
MVVGWTPLMEAAPTVTSVPTAARCEWAYEGTSRQRGILTLLVASAYTEAPGSTPVANIGEAAYAFEIPIARTIEIGFKKGALFAICKYSALVLPAGKTWPVLRDAAIELARTAASRVP